MCILETIQNDSFIGMNTLSFLSYFLIDRMILGISAILGDTTK